MQDSKLIRAVRNICTAMKRLEATADANLIIQINLADEYPVIYDAGRPSAHTELVWTPLIDDLIAGFRSLVPPNRLAPSFDLIMEEGTTPRVSISFYPLLEWKASGEKIPAMFRELEQRLIPIYADLADTPACKFFIQTQSPTAFQASNSITISAASAKEAIYAFGSIRNRGRSVKQNTRDVIAVSMECAESTWGLS